MRRAKLVMNITSVLDILIILFFAQAIYYQDFSKKKIDGVQQTANKENKELKGNLQDLKTAYDNILSEYNTLQTSNKEIQSINKDLQEQLAQKKIELTNIQEQLAQKKIELTNIQKRLADEQIITQNLAKVLTEKSDTITELDSKYKDLDAKYQSIKLETQTVGEHLELGPIMEVLQPEKGELSKDEATRKVIAYIQTQRILQQQTEKEISFWIFTVGSKPDSFDKTISNPVIHLYINGKKSPAKEWSEKYDWKWKNPQKFQEQLYNNLCNKDLIPDSDVHGINIILWFTLKGAKTKNVSAFNNIFRKTILQLQDTYSKDQSVETPKGRGIKGIRLIPIDRADYSQPLNDPILLFH